MIHFYSKKLSNGLRLLNIPIKESNAITILFIVGTGSRYETTNQNGISHFLEHMFFKGTTKRPTTSDISYELDSIGASYNAFTSEEYTGFYVQCAKSKIEIAMDILSDILIDSQFNEKDISKEKNVIIEEINMYEDLPQRQIVDITKEHFFGNTPLGRSTLGNKKNIRSFRKKDFIKYLSDHYSTKNSILAIAGGEVNNIFSISSKYFSNFNKEKFNDYEKIYTKNNKLSVRIKYKKTDQAHLTLGLTTFERKSNDRYALKLINNILGETMSSRLFTEIREKRGLAYYVGSDDWYFHDTGALVAYAGVDTKRIDESISVIKNEIEKLAQNTITEKELQKAKDNLEGKMYLGLETTFSYAEYFAEQELLYGKIMQPEEIVDKIKSISINEINTLTKKIIKNKIKLTIIGPYKNENRFIKLIK